MKWHFVLLKSALQNFAAFDGVCECVYARVRARVCGRRGRVHACVLQRERERETEREREREADRQTDRQTERTTYTNFSYIDGWSTKRLLKREVNDGPSHTLPPFPCTTSWNSESAFWRESSSRTWNATQDHRSLVRLWLSFCDSCRSSIAQSMPLWLLDLPSFSTPWLRSLAVYCSLDHGNALIVRYCYIHNIV